MAGLRTRRSILRSVAAIASGLAAGACSSRWRDQSAPGRPAHPPVRLEQRDGMWWLVPPNGKPFFSVGVSVLNAGVPRVEHDLENPAYAAWQLYPTERAWCDAAVE